MVAPVHPLRDAHLWISVLWALVLAVGIAAWDWTEARLTNQAGLQHALLLPAQEITEEERGAERDRLLKEPGVAGAVWVSPADQSARLSQQYPGKLWGGMFSDEQSWLPWILEVGFNDPLDSSEEITAFAARRGGDPAWAVMTWDNGRLSQLRQARTQVRAVGGALLAFVLLAGAAALLSTPATGSAAGAMWRAVLGAGMSGAVLGAALLSGVPVGARTATIALGAGFVLAAFIAPMLRQVRGRQLSVSVGEGSQERLTP